MLVNISHLSVTLRGHGTAHCALDDVSLSLQAGQHTALLGPNGAGKSTLLALLRGELWPDPGSGGIRWYPPPQEQAAQNTAAQSCGDDSPLTGRAMSALVSASQHENYLRQAWDLRGEDLLLTGLEDSPLLYTLPPQKHSAAVRELAENLHIDNLLQRSINSLSQGQLRLLLLARALVRRPALLLLDECLDGLDAQARKIFLKILEAHSATSTVVLTSHRAHTLPSWIHHRLYMQAGKLYSAPPPAPKSDLNPHPQHGPKPQACPSPSHRTDQSPLVQVCNATVYVERTALLHHINWTISPGEHWLLRGENGSGKSTLLRLLSGDEYPAAGGSIERHLPRCLGHDAQVPELEYIRRGVRLVSDLNQAVYEYELTAEELVLSGFDGSVGLYREFTKDEHREALHWLRRVGMEEYKNRSFRSLSTGQTRRLFLARALVGRPDLLLLDEPCSGLDAPSRTHILHILDALAAEGIQTVLVSHHGEDRLQACNREALVHNGQLQIVR